jgi:hypothetical protein
MKPIELFKLHLGNCLEKFKPKLPKPLTYKKAIADYLCKIGEVNKQQILYLLNELHYITL